MVLPDNHHHRWKSQVSYRFPLCGHLKTELAHCSVPVSYTHLFMNVAMFNPRIVKKSGSYQTEEGCLSLIGVRPCTRYQEIELEYQDMNWKKQRQKYTGWIAQIIQHEIDHCNGIVI